MEVRMDASGLRVDEVEERLAELERLLERAVFEDAADDGELGGERLELPVARRVGDALRVADDARERARQLHVRVEVDVGARGAEERLLSGLLGQLVLQLLVELVAPPLDLLELAAPALPVEVDAGQFERGQRDDALEL